MNASLEVFLTLLTLLVLRLVLPALLILGLGSRLKAGRHNA